MANIYESLKLDDFEMFNVGQKLTNAQRKEIIDILSEVPQYYETLDVDKRAAWLTALIQKYHKLDITQKNKLKQFIKKEINPKKVGENKKSFKNNDEKKIDEIERQVSLENWTNKDVDKINELLKKLPKGKQFDRVRQIKRDMDQIIAKWIRDAGDSGQYYLGVSSPEDWNLTDKLLNEQAKESMKYFFKNDDEKTKRQDIKVSKVEWTKGLYSKTAIGKVACGVEYQDDKSYRDFIDKKIKEKQYEIVQKTIAKNKLRVNIVWLREERKGLSDQQILDKLSSK
jgi:hypothetical protein